MKKHRAVLVISVILMVAALVGSLFLDDVLGSRISNVVTIVTAIVGAVALFVQFKKDKDLNMASFVIDYSVQFYDIYNLGDVLDELEKCRVNPEQEFDVKKHYKETVAYLQWLESLASLVNTPLTEAVSPSKSIFNIIFYIIYS